MFTTLLAILTTLVLYFSAGINVAEIYLPTLTVIMGLASFMMAMLVPILFALAWQPLQNSSRIYTPRLMELFKLDVALGWAKAWLFAFPFLTMILALDLFVLGAASKVVLLSVWVITLGLSFDCLAIILKRLVNYQNPDFVVTMCAQEAKKCIQDDQELDLCRWIDSLSEIGVKALEKHSPSLANEAVNQSPGIIKLFLDASKSVAHTSQDRQSKEMGISDKISYTLFFQFQRLESVFDKALEKSNEPVCSNILAVLGKIAIACSQLDLSLASYPIHFLGKFAQKAQEKKISEVPVKASYTLFEVSKTIIQAVNTPYGDLKDPLLSLITQMHEIAKETFRQNRDVNLSLITQPFKDLKELFNNDQVANHQDTPVILANIDRVLGEFEALEMVMRSIPPIPQEESVEDTSNQDVSRNC